MTSFAMLNSSCCGLIFACYIDMSCSWTTVARLQLVRYPAERICFSFHIRYSAEVLILKPSRGGMPEAGRIELWVLFYLSIPL